MFGAIRQTMIEFRNERRRRVLERMARQLGDDVHAFWLEARAAKRRPVVGEPS